MGMINSRVPGITYISNVVYRSQIINGFGPDWPMVAYNDIALDCITNC